MLDSLSGRVVFVDFWASWCSPCLREMQYSKELQHQLAGKTVAFLYLSTNTDRGSWMKGLERIDMPGHHYRIEPLEKNRFKKYFRIPGIPCAGQPDTLNMFQGRHAEWRHGHEKDFSY